MRIAVVAPLVAPIRPGQARGNHALIVDVARGLAARRHDVRVWCAAGSRIDGVDVEAVEVDEDIRSAFIVPGLGQAGGRPRSDRDRDASRSEAGPGGPGGAGSSDGMRRAFERVFEGVRRWQPDAVSQHAFDVEAFELAEPFPAVHTLHLPPIVPAVVAACRTTTRRVAAVSEHGRRQWCDTGVPDVLLLRNGVPDLAGAAIAGPEPAGRAITRPSAHPEGRPADDRVALIAARISPEKGVDVALRVARRAGLRPVLAGEVYDREYHQRRVVPLLGGAEWLGPVSRERLAGLMARAAVVLMPVCWDEPFGLVAAEAQMAGCPVVAYRRGALPEIVPDGVGGRLVDPGDETALAEACGEVGGLDRDEIRRRALAALSIDRTLDAYEAALAATA